MVDAVGNAVGDLLHFVDTHPTGGNGGSTQPQTGGDEGAALLTGNGVLVGGNVYLIQIVLQLLAGALLIGEVYQQQVVVGAGRIPASRPGPAAAGP